MLKINRKSLSEQIYAILKMDILKRKIPFGSKLVNRELQERFKVSSSPIRDAINRLNQDGLITSIDKTGATVVEFTYDFFVEVNEILLYIVITGIRLSSEKSDPETISDELKKYIKLQEENIGTDKFYEYDYKFHKAFIDYSYNTRLTKMFKEHNVLHEMLVRSFYKLSKINIREESIKNHKRILKAIGDKDYYLAVKITEEHYKAAEKIVKDMVNKKEIDEKNLVK